MEMCLGLLQTRGSKILSLTLLYSMLFTWTSVESWSYYYSNTTMNWTEARTWCQTHYTDMVAIQNQEEIKHLNQWLPLKSKYYWIGIRKINKVWTWVGTNKTLTEEATNWADGEPNNGKNKYSKENEDCVEMYIKRKLQSGKWNDEKCGNLKTALCYTAACKNDSCHYGDCVETINSHKCACFEGFYGDKCEQVVKCKQQEVTVPHKGSVSCTHKYGNFSYNSSCEYSCETGYQLTMSRPLRCTATQQWSEEPPACKVVQCPQLSSPARGSMTCTNPLGLSSYLSTCVFTCDEGFEQTGSASNTLQCEASGSWNASQPSCVAIPLPAIQELQNGFVSCGNVDERFTPRRSCNFSCASGYRLVGPSTLTYTSTADLNEKTPRCEAITCQNPEGDTQLISKCSKSPSELRPGSSCSFSCRAGFKLKGVDTVQCSDNGEWSKPIPTCQEITCPAPESPTNGQISCRSPSLTETSHPLGMICTFSCDEGHELQGAHSMECEHSGQWTSTPPTCTAVSCPLLQAPENGLINCSNSEPVYNSQCSFTCSQDYTLNGHKLLICDHYGNWTGERPTCQASPYEIAALASSLTTGGALLSALSLVIWILKRFQKQKRDTFELSSCSDIETNPTEVYRNSTDSLI